MEALSIPDEERAQSMDALLDKLNRMSVIKRFEAYRDVAWDAPEHRIDPEDPIWELPLDHALGATDWYRAQPPEVRARIGLYVIATSMKIGVQFENLLTRGLLAFALEQPNGSSLFRYLYHEAIEESQHSLMFQEFVNRAGVDVEPLVGWRGLVGSRIPRLAVRFPELFFVFVLGGEDPIDHAQRTALGSGQPIHPLLKRISQIHITEEARHLAFARAFLRERVPRMPAWKRAALAVLAPIILHLMARAMLQPSEQLVRTFGVPREVMHAAYHNNPAQRARLRESLAKVYALLSELGITRARLTWWPS